MDYMELYNTNADFKGYVDRYRRKHALSVVEALEHMLVRNYAEMVLEKVRQTNEEEKTFNT